MDPAELQGAYVVKIAVFCNGTVLLPTLEALYSQELLVGVAVPDSAGGEDIHLPLEAVLRQAEIPFLRVSRTDLTGQLVPWLVEIAADVVCCMGFPCKIPAELLELPRFGFYNLHGGALPRYRGPDPVFWQIRNREAHGAIAIHRMTSKIDAGGVAHAERVILGPDDTYTLHMQRLGAVLPRVMIEFVQQLALRGDTLPLQEQEASAARYLPRPSEVDRTIDWSQSAAEIDALVRACNPVYGGALTLLKGIPVRLLEVLPGPTLTDDQTLPGTIIATGGVDGIRVACGQGESLVPEIVYGMDGFFTGRRLAKIFGLRPGDRMA
jgi:methionyl-tRNA formyltransferase